MLFNINIMFLNKLDILIRLIEFKYSMRRFITAHAHANLAKEIRALKATTRTYRQEEMKVKELADEDEKHATERKAISLANELIENHMQPEEWRKWAKEDGYGILRTLDVTKEDALDAIHVPDAQMRGFVCRELASYANEGHRALEFQSRYPGFAATYHYSFYRCGINVYLK